MGVYDVPAFVDKVRELAGVPTVTLIGYSTGAVAQVVAFSKIREQLEGKVNKSVMLAPCIYSQEWADENSKQYFDEMRAGGINYMFGPTWQTDIAALCANPATSLACQFN